jgi:monofunctional biosynthetic peptidoglycan transglycosylase
MTVPTHLVAFGTKDRGMWRTITDGVMGGLSRSDLRRTDRATGVFEGLLSLKNNGGFASVQVVVGLRDLSAYDGLETRVRGDGRTYQLRLRTDDNLDGIAYRAHVETRDGQWTTSRIAFDRFVPTFRGRTPHGAPPLDTARIHQVAFMLADKRPGTFSLEIDHVRAWNAATIDP